MNKSKKLVLKKDKIASLSNQEMKAVEGGTLFTIVLVPVTISISGVVTQSEHSTNHKFTCGLCTGGNTNEC